MAKTQQTAIGALIFFGYLLVRLGFDSFWTEFLGGYGSYVFEITLVGAMAFARPTGFGFALPTWNTLPYLLFPAFLSGFGIFQLGQSSGILFPFDLSSTETLVFLLLVAPVLEELLFRGALWEAVSRFCRKQTSVLLWTSLAFGVGHLIALYRVPQEFRPFVLIQFLYVILLGLGAGWARIASGSLVAPILVHFSFNLGFFAASLPSN